MPERTANVLTRAAVLLGGVRQLAQRLNVAEDDLVAWIGSPTTAPEDVLANATAIVDAFAIDRTGTVLLRLHALNRWKQRSR